MHRRAWVTGPDVSLSLHSDDPEVGPEVLNGIIDTGASIICIDNRIAKRLGLIASNRKPVQMADGRVVMSAIYAARMTIPVLEFDDIVQVCGVEMDFPSSRVLIGRSFLKDYIVNYDGPKELFEFHETDRGSEYFHFDHDE